MIEGVVITPLRQIIDKRGKVMHMLRCDNEIFSKFGEIYFSTINPKSIKAWKLHKEMILNCCVPHGKVKFVIHDARTTSKTNGVTAEYIMSPEEYFLITVPPMVWTGFQCLSEKPSILVNCATIPHDTDEYERMSESNDLIPYNWQKL